MRRTPRETYREVLAQLTAAREERAELQPIARTQVDAFVHDFVGRNIPKGMRNTKENRAKVQTALAEEIKAKMEALPSVLRYRALDESVRQLTIKLHAIAPGVPILPGDVRVVVKSVDASAYHTVGLGAESYARGTVKITQRSLAKYHPNIRTEMQVQEHEALLPPHHKRRTYVLHAYVKEEIDGDLIEHAEGFTIKEYLQACWAEGCNPRVFNPMLPHGLEEKFGLDYFGNEKKL